VVDHFSIRSDSNGEEEKQNKREQEQHEGIYHHFTSIDLIVIILQFLLFLLFRVVLLD